MISKILQILGLKSRISKVFPQSLEQFFLTVGQNNFGNKIPFLLGCKKLYYCGKNCLKKAWKSYHSKECGFLKDISLEDLEDLDFERMVIRTILRYIHEPWMLLVTHSFKKSYKINDPR